MNVEQGIAISGGDFLVMGDGQFAMRRIANNIDLECRVLSQIVFKSALVGDIGPFDDGVIAAVRHNVSPGVLQSFADFPFLGENENARGIFIQSVNDENAVIAIFLSQIVTDKAISSPAFM